MSKVRLYFATDVHASERCWKKFLAAPKFYGASIAVMGGDITGKVIVPLMRHPNGDVTATFNGIERVARTETDRALLSQQILDSGAYVCEMTGDEFAQIEDLDGYLQGRFRDLAQAQVERWVEMAETRLSGTGIRCLINGGNDDPFEIDDVLRSSDSLEVPHESVIELADGLYLLGLGYANETPWHCARDISEQSLAEKLEGLATSVPDPSRAIYDIHVPPYGSGLDSAPKLDENHRIVLGAHGPLMIPVGSTAVRDAMLSHAPLLGVHGHVHESRGVTKVGRALAVNPGSEYREGVLHGAVIDIDARKAVASVQLVSG
jgi:uncharacterized protein